MWISCHHYRIDFTNFYHPFPFLFHSQSHMHPLILFSFSHVPQPFMKTQRNKFVILLPPMSNLSFHRLHPPSHPLTKSSLHTLLPATQLNYNLNSLPFSNQTLKRPTPISKMQPMPTSTLCPMPYLLF